MMRLPPVKMLSQRVIPLLLG